MKKNIPLLLMSLLFFMAADAQAQEVAKLHEDSCCIDKTNFYAKIFGGANFLQNTTIEGNKATYQTGYIVAGSLGYCWRIMACVWKVNMLLEEMTSAKSISLQKVLPSMDISKLPRIWPTYYGICLYVRGGAHFGISNLLLELA